MRVLKLLGFIIVVFFLLDKGLGHLANSNRAQSLMAAEEMYSIATEVTAGRTPTSAKSKIGLKVQEIMQEAERLHIAFRLKYDPMIDRLEEPGWTTRASVDELIKLGKQFPGEGVAIAEKQRQLYDGFVEVLIEEMDISRASALKHPAVRNAHMIQDRHRRLYDVFGRRFSAAYVKSMQFIQANRKTMHLDEDWPDWRDPKLQARWQTLVADFAAKYDKFAQAQLALGEEIRELQESSMKKLKAAKGS